MADSIAKGLLQAQLKAIDRWLIYMWYPIAVYCPIAVLGPVSGPKDVYRDVDRYRRVSHPLVTLGDA